MAQPQPTLDNEGILYSDSGFSIIEALVVMLIGSMLLSILTPMLISSQQTNEKISEIFQNREDHIFFNMQFSELLDSFIDPALETSGLAIGDDPSFIGSSVTFSAKARRPFKLTDTTSDVWIGWTKHNPLQIDKSSSASGDNKLIAQIGNQWILWPQIWPDDAKFFYIDSEGEKHPSWPPVREIESIINSGSQTIIQELPLAIEIEFLGRSRNKPSYFIYNLKL